MYPNEVQFNVLLELEAPEFDAYGEGEKKQWRNSILKHLTKAIGHRG